MIISLERTFTVIIIVSHSPPPIPKLQTIGHDLYHGRWNRMAQGVRAPQFSKTRAKCAISSNLVAFLENFEDARKDSKIHVSSDFSRSKFQNSPGGACLRNPLAALHLETGIIFTLCNHAKCFVVSFSVLPSRLSAQCHFQKPPKVPLIPSSLLF